MAKNNATKVDNNSRNNNRSISMLRNKPETNSKEQVQATEIAKKIAKKTLIIAEK